MDLLSNMGCSIRPMGRQCNTGIHGGLYSSKRANLCDDSEKPLEIGGSGDIIQVEALVGLSGSAIAFIFALTVWLLGRIALSGRPKR